MSRPTRTAERIIYRDEALQPPALRRLIDAIREEQARSEAGS